MLQTILSVENDELLHRNIIKELNVLTDSIIQSTGVVAIELLDIVLGEIDSVDLNRDAQEQL